MDEFWTEQLPVEAGLSVKLHTSQEEYFGTESRLERDYLAHDAGKRIYVVGRPITPRMGPAQRAGNAQVWFYPADGVLVLWECYLYEHVREAQRPVEDGLHVATWRAFESEMIRRFRPAVVVCPAWEPVYETEDWQAFLESEGYAIEENKRLAVKRLGR